MRNWGFYGIGLGESEKKEQKYRMINTKTGKTDHSYRIVTDNPRQIARANRYFQNEKKNKQWVKVKSRQSRSIFDI